ncbi:MAG: glycosyltransferase [Blastocatellales bacterium]
MEISLVIPVRDESETIGDLIHCIKAQTLQPFEVIFADGGSRDGTVGIIKELDRSRSKFKVVRNENGMPGPGRNSGIDVASCEWIALTDAGIRLDSDWLSNLAVATEADPSPDIVYGNYEPVIRNFFDRCAALAYVPAKVQRPGGMMRGPSIASCLMKKSVWESVGGFPGWRAAEDLIFMRRVEEAGFRIGWVPKATVHWQMRPDLASTFRKFVLYSRHNVWAGMQSDWHYGVARQYAVWLVAVLMMWMQSWWWGLVPAVLLVARTFKSIWTKREGRGILWALNPVQFLGVAGILLTIDIAMFAGWIQAIFERPQQAG